MPVIRGHLTMHAGGGYQPPGMVQPATRRPASGVRPQPPTLVNLRPSNPSHHPVLPAPPFYDVEVEEDDRTIVLPPLTPAEWWVMEDALKERARAMVERPGLTAAVDLLAKIRPASLVRRPSPTDPVQLVLDTDPTPPHGIHLDGLA